MRKMFKDMDEALYEECRLNYEAEEVRPSSQQTLGISREAS